MDKFVDQIDKWLKKVKSKKVKVISKKLCHAGSIFVVVDTDGQATA